MNRWDAGLACGVLLLAAVLWLVPSPQGTSVVLQGPQGMSRVDLSVNASYSVVGNLGLVEFRVLNGHISCVHSSCNDSLCVRMGPLAPGRPIVCAPNGVVARFDQSGGVLDAVSR